MKETPLLMCAEMVRATLEGRKTQTRRIVKFPVIDRNGTGCEIAGCEINSMLRQEADQGAGSFICRYGGPGDRLWVRETWGPCDGGFCYRASEGPNVKPDDGKWHPSIHMFREASRITLEIVSVRVERVQDISEDDAIAEGLELLKLRFYKAYNCKEGFTTTAKRSYETLWDSLNAKRDKGKYAWAKNPYVWVIEFKKL